jgi:hypothetical protein
MPEWARQRRFPRYMVNLSLLYEVAPPADTGVGVGWTLELSEGGACIELAERLPPPTPLRLHLQGEGGVIDVEGRVVWAGEPDLPGGICHGVAFTQIAPDRLPALRTLLHCPGPERRGGLRLHLDLAVTYRRTGPASAPLLGRTGDVSRGGLLLHLPEVLTPGTALAVTLHTPTEPLTMEGRIVWVEPPGVRTPGHLIAHGFHATRRSRSGARAPTSLVGESL